ncbi:MULTISPECIES: YdcF family protein [Rhizobium]|uniref:YdcF family protein n=1 Tax=Rhizobium rhododendri TaxID=2506430 RepID=A0ABY8IP33_9HYPH|nr:MULTISPECIES: YdcF family protein [Rhizobium]TQX86832.1 YdcF family protein [Rhizobium sp. rho-13.1]TQY11440.1 YdcF family protein [Rhizobium sp. rho-1.1]WFS25046.1 YdcF family protein [Rhizobium rhododendri]
MFIISKVIWILLQPFSLSLIFCVFALVAIWFRRRRLSLLLVLVPASILLVALFTTTGVVMVEALEDRFPRPSADPLDVQCAIILGGGFTNDVDTVRGGYEMTDAGDRFVEALRLANKFSAMRIIVSGGDGFITGGYLGDGIIAERMFTVFGIKHDRLLQDSTSRTTFENAINTKKLLEANGLSHCLLVTSGFHMPRSVGIFRKLGIDVIPWVTDYRTIGTESLRFDISQPEANASLLGVAAKEWIGMVGYYMSGRTSSLYPGPSQNQ